MATIKLVADWGTITLPASMRPSLWLFAAEHGNGGAGHRAREDKAGDEAAGEGLRILLVEDDDALAIMYSVRLERAGFQVSRAADGVAALRTLKTEQFDLVFMDINLPKMGGLDVLEAVRKEKGLKDLPVVVLSNYSEPTLRQRGLGLGAIEYLVKSEITPSFLARKAPDWAAR